MHAGNINKLNNIAMNNETNTDAAPKTKTSAKVEAKTSNVFLSPELERVLNEARSQMGTYAANLPPALAERVRNGSKTGLRITSIRDAIRDDDEHGQAYLVSARLVEAIETVCIKAASLSADRAKAKERARNKASK